MWKCELCRKEFNYDTMAIDLRFGYVDSEEVKSGTDPYDAFATEEGIGPICNDCAIAYIRGEKINAWGI
ncbi:MAG: hypothetical protein HY805_07850 [Nitrospirae bacterium]|nr:hypothetical protein [Nitrospirota bacterium]